MPEGEFINPALNSGPTFFSIDQAKGALREPAPAPKTSTSAAALETGQQPRPERPAPAERPDPAPAQEQAAEPEPETPEPAPADEGGEKTEGEQLSPVELPRFWKKADLAVFQALPRDAQLAIVEREQDRENGVKAELKRTADERKAAADERKAAEAERQAVQTQRQTYGQQLDTLIPLLHQQLMGEFADIKTPLDYARLCAEDPARAKRFDGQQAVMNAALQQRQLIQHHENAQAEEARRTRLADAEKRLVETFPEWKDVERGRKEIGEIRTYLQANYDVPDGHIAGLTEPYQFQVIRKAMLYDKAQKAKEAAVERPVPRNTQTPGRGKTAADRARDQREAIQQRYEKTGDLRDLVGILRS